MRTKVVVEDEAKRVGSMLHAAMDGSKYISLRHARRRITSKSQMIAENFTNQIRCLWKHGEVGELAMCSKPVDVVVGGTKVLRGVADRVRVLKDHKTNQKYIEVCDIKTTAATNGTPTEQDLTKGLMQACIYGHMLKDQIYKHRTDIQVCKWLWDAIRKGEYVVSAKVAYYNQSKNMIRLWQAGKKESFKGLRGLLEQRVALDHESILPLELWKTWLKASPSATVSAMCQERLPSLSR